MFITPLSTLSDNYFLNKLSTGKSQVMLAFITCSNTIDLSTEVGLKSYTQLFTSPLVWWYHYLLLKQGPRWLPEPFFCFRTFSRNISG